MHRALEKLGIKPAKKISLEILLGESFNGHLYGMSEEEIDRVNALRDIVSEYNCTGRSKSKTITNSREAAMVVHASMKNLGHEEVRVAFLNSANRLITTEQIFKGSTSEVIINPKNILSKALSMNASGIILFHNHPSENVNPSRNDIEQTSRLKDACKALDICLLDHIIIGKHSYYSFSDETVSSI